MHQRFGREGREAVRKEMLTHASTELSEVYHRGLAASTLITQPFWKDLQIYMNQQVLDAMNGMGDAKFATDEVKARRVDRWLTIRDLVARIEQFPLAAIEAAREFRGTENE